MSIFIYLCTNLCVNTFFLRNSISYPGSYTWLITEPMGTRDSEETNWLLL